MKGLYHDVVVDWTMFSVGSVLLKWGLICTNKNKTEIEHLYTYTVSYVCH